VECNARAEDVQPDRPDVEPLPLRWRRDPQPTPGEARLHEPHTGQRIQKRPGDDRTDPAAMQNAGDAADVVEVIVREDQERDVRDCEVVQAPVDRHRVRSGIDHDGRMRSGRKHERVALPDVARDEDPVRCRPSRGHRSDRNQHDHRCGRGRGKRAPRPNAHRDRQQADGEHQ
jgi:hypothetical protein